MSHQPNNYGYRDPYESAPQYGSAGGSGPNNYNPLMTGYGLGAATTQPVDRLIMRKQGNPTQLASQVQPGYYPPDYHQNTHQAPIYYSDSYQGGAVNPQRLTAGSSQSAPLQLNQSRAEPARGEAQAPPKEAAASGTIKVAVESETVYPKPHKGDSLLGVFFTDPAKFEGKLS